MRKPIALLVAVLAIGAAVTGVLNAANNPYGIVKGLNGNWAIVDCYSGSNQQESCTEHWVIGAGSQDPVAGFGEDGDLFWRTDTKAFRTKTAGVWGAVSSVGSSFPITAASGATTVTLTGDAAAATGSYLIVNATEGAGWNAALGGALGASIFAFNATDSASASVDLTTGTAGYSYTVGTQTYTLNIDAPSESAVQLIVDDSSDGSQSLVQVVAGGTISLTSDDGSDSTDYEFTPTGFHAFGSSVASAATIVPPSNFFSVTGTTSITSISNPTNGKCIVMRFLDVLTVTDGGNLFMAGNFVTSAEDTLSLCGNGSNWYETARSVN